jgi:hypothetical protein
LGAKEDGTNALVSYIKENTDKDDYVMCDYAELNFYAKRKTTPKVAGMSKAAVDCGGINSDRLINELNSFPVKLVLLHLEGGIPAELSPFFELAYGPHHFDSLIHSKTGAKFMNYIQANYNFVKTFNRSGQIFNVYKRK